MVATVAYHTHPYRKIPTLGCHNDYSDALTEDEMETDHHSHMVCGNLLLCSSYSN